MEEQDAPFLPPYFPIGSLNSRDASSHPLSRWVAKQRPSRLTAKKEQGYARELHSEVQHAEERHAT
jgi:hypothetical protein